MRSVNGRMQCEPGIIWGFPPVHVPACPFASPSVTMKKYLGVQVQVVELSFAYGRHRLAVHGEVHLSAVALDGDVVPVLVVQNVAGGQRGPAVHLVHHAAPCGTRVQTVTEGSTWVFPPGGKKKHSDTLELSVIIRAAGVAAEINTGPPGDSYLPPGNLLISQHPLDM